MRAQKRLLRQVLGFCGVAAGEAEREPVHGIQPGQCLFGKSRLADRQIAGLQRLCRLRTHRVEARPANDVWQPGAAHLKLDFRPVPADTRPQPPLD